MPNHECTHATKEFVTKHYDKGVLIRVGWQCMAFGTRGYISPAQYERIMKSTFEKQKKCVHEKIYEQSVLCSYPAQRCWICKKCGKRGTETEGSYVDMNEFYHILEKFRNFPNLEEELTDVE